MHPNYFLTQLFQVLLCHIYEGDLRSPCEGKECFLVSWKQMWHSFIQGQEQLVLKSGSYDPTKHHNRVHGMEVVIKIWVNCFLLCISWVSISGKKHSSTPMLSSAKLTRWASKINISMKENMKNPGKEAPKHIVQKPRIGREKRATQI